MHRLLRRQLQRHTSGGAGAVPEEWDAFVAAVDTAYHQSDSDRNMLERLLELSSRELLQANSEMQAVFQALPDLFFRIDTQGTILDHKGAAGGDFYLTPDLLDGKRIQDIPVLEVSRRFEAAIQQVLAEQSLVRIEYSLRITANDRSYEARLLPLLGDQIVVIIRNITEQKEAERKLAEKAQELVRSNAELQHFAYVASHDLQEPLRTVQSYLQLLERRYKDKLDSDANDFINYAVEGAKRMRELIEDLLSYARVTAQMKPIEPVDLMAAVDQVIGNLSGVIQESGVKITRDDLPTVMADRRQIAQLYQNLISNALKFRREEPPRVHLSARQNDDEWSLSVKDNGIGIDPRYVEKIFVIFQRLHSREEYVGTGIGLAICNKIVERHGGRIWVESQLDMGSTFFFTLPRKEVP